MTITPTLEPSLEAFAAHSGDHSHVALSATFMADEETPISLFRRLAEGRPRAFLLESVSGGEQLARYSFMGCDVTRTLVFDDGVATIHGSGGRRIPSADPLGVLRNLLADYRVAPREDLPRFQGGAVGYIGFDCIRYLEPVPLPPGRGVGLPEMAMLLPEELLIYDHTTHRLTIVVHARLDGDRRLSYRRAQARVAELLARLSIPRHASPVSPLPTEPPPPPFTANCTAEDYCAAVGAAQQAIHAGEAFQVVVSRRETAEVDVDPLDLYRALRSLSPAPYMFYLAFDTFHVVGASPEVLVRLENHELLVRPIAGTRRRGATPAEDLALEEQLLADPKELAEHRMLVDLGRNDLGRVAKVGSVRVEHPLHIERFSHVMHIVTDVRADLAPGLDAFDVFRACFPAGTVSGAPKIRACELLATLEPDRRGVYAGAVGYFDYRGNMDTAIAIRTAIVEPGRVHLQAGAGIVFDSIAESEFEECHNKMAASRAAVARVAGRT